MLPNIIDWAKAVSPRRQPECRTISLRQAREEVYLTINSTAFPKVALTNAPGKFLNASDGLSNASDTAAERGLVAKKLKIEVDIAFQWRTQEVRRREDPK